MTGPLDFRLFKSFCFAIHKFKIHSHDYDVLWNPMYCTLMLFKRHYTSISNSVQSILRMVWFLMQEIQTLKQWGQSQSANKAIVLAVYSCIYCIQLQFFLQTQSIACSVNYIVDLSNMCGCLTCPMAFEILQLTHCTWVNTAMLQFINSFL